MPKPHRLTSGDEIRATIRAGKRASNQTLTIHFVSGTGRFAFITPKTLGVAVKRNLVRRRGRAVLAKHLSEVANLDAVFRFHPAAATQDFKTIEKSIEDLITRSIA